MVRPLYTEENEGERTPHLLLASILTTEKKTPATQPRGGSGAAKGMVVADSMGEWEWCRWQTTWESGSGAGGRQHGRMGRGKWQTTWENGKSNFMGTRFVVLVYSIVTSEG
ncbi:hypothetical protein E1A91_A12G166100v1 [Gossypium mustelinum]|uniref:Uncharacterized protein n=1 Tax=Gossypium mustelinum TaxID=34275 RepID=A0A5D2WV22_GOSMU|nr:hypothetical protein E1A91_A12G166100v1 [Gossypium mustelinum]